MTRKRPKVSSGGKVRGTPNVSRAHGAVRKLLDTKQSGDEKEVVEDPRFQNLYSKKISRKERRKQERQAKKDRIRAFHSRKKLAEAPLPSKQTAGHPTRKQAQESHGAMVDGDEEDERAKVEAAQKRKKEAAARKKEKQKEKRAKALEERRKRDLLEANELEDRNIKRLQKSLRFRKKKKTKEVIIPAQFKYDGLDYLLDVIDSKKLEILKEEEKELTKEMELDQVKERQEKLAQHLDDSDQSSDDDSEYSLDDNRIVNDGTLGKGDGGGNDGESDSDTVDDGGTIGFRSRERESDGLSGDSDDGDGLHENRKEVNTDGDLVSGRGGLGKKHPEEVSSDRPAVRGEQGGAGVKSQKDEAKHMVGKHKGKPKLVKKRDKLQEFDAENEDTDRNSSDEDSGMEEGIHDHDSPGRKRKSHPKVDPYGRTPGEGNDKDRVSYIPPHKKAAMMGENMDSHKKAELEKLQRQLKGLINRLSLSKLSFISKEIEGIFLTKSRNDMNESLCGIIQEALIIDTMSGERLVMEVVLLIAVLHYNVGSEVGAHFLQSMAVKFDQLHRTMADLDNKSCDNALLVLIHLYNFKIVHCCLMYDIIRRLVEGFTEQDIEMLLMILKSAGMSLRKDDPLALKEIILSIQAKSASLTDELKQQSRVRFMLDTITALRNNDIRKMATNSNMEHLDTLRKTLRSLTKNREHSTETNLRIPLDDLLSADQKGRWWIVGSAWTGLGPNRGEQ